MNSFTIFLISYGIIGLMMNNKFFLYKILPVYQIIVWILGIIVLIKESYQLIVAYNNFGLLFILLALFFVGVYIVYVNFCIFFGLHKNKHKSFLIFNKWVIFAQIIQLSLFGFTGYVIVGVQLGLVYSYTTIQSLNPIFAFYRFDIAINYHNSDSLWVAVNIFPILIFVWMDKGISKLFDHG